MILMNRFVLVATLIVAALSSSPAFADGRVLSGTYDLSANCEVAAGFFGTKTLPQGEITVTENIPVVSDDAAHTQFAGIIFQSGDKVDSLLTLAIGKVAFFQFGPEPVQEGKYSDNGATFVEQYTSAGASSADGEIVLVKTSSGLQINSVDPVSGKITAQCSLASAR